MFEKEKIIQKGDNNFALINSTVKISSAGDELQRLLQEGKHLEATAFFERIMKGAYAQHPAFPHWRYEMQMEQGHAVLAHVPNYPEAMEKYPMKGNIKFQIPSQYAGFKDMGELLQNAYGKQEEIEVNVLSLRTWIGEHIIEEREAIEQGEIKAIFKPRPFPEPEPMKLYIKNSHYSIDYLEIGVSKIVGQVITMDNNKQSDARILITLVIDLVNNRSNFNLKVAEKYKNDIEANLLLNQFLLEVNEGKQFALKMLREGKDFFVSQQWALDDPVPSNLGEYVRLLTDLYEIQSIYQVNFYMSDNFNEDDMEKLYLLKLSAEGKPREGKYTDYKIEVIGKKAVQSILELNDKSSNGNTLSIVTSDKSITFLGTVIPFKEYRLDFHYAVLKDSEKIRRKMELMDYDESMSIQFEPINKEKNNFSEYYIFK